MTSKREQTEKRHKMFLQIWDEREEQDGDFKFVTCFETGVRLSRTTYRKNTACYSHILAKSKYPQYDLVKKNVVIVHPDAHGQYENNRDKAPKQNQLRNELLQLHYLGNLKD